MIQFTRVIPRTAVVAAIVCSAVAGSLYAAGASAAPEPHGRMADRCERLNERLAHLDRDLTRDQVKDIIEGRLAESGNKNL